MVLLMLEKQNNRDIELIQCGWEACEPGHYYGPAIRTFYLMHFCRAGRGIFRAEGRQYTLGPGQGFLIFPGQVTYYEADEADPWDYVWIGFEGEKAPDLVAACGLTKGAPVINGGEAVAAAFERITRCGEPPGRSLLLMSCLYDILGGLAAAEPGGRAEEKSAEKYARQAMELINRNFSTPVTVTGIARELSLSRSYFSWVFKKAAGTSPQRFLIETRIAAACELLKNTKLSVGDIARSVGYENTFLFSRLFKKSTGLSPTAFRQSMGP